MRWKLPYGHNHTPLEGNPMREIEQQVRLLGLPAWEGIKPIKSEGRIQAAHRPSQREVCVCVGGASLPP